MKSRMLTCITTLTLLSALPIPVQLAAQDNPHHQPTFTTFDAPGAGTGPNQGTFASGINPAGAITGFYYDANYVGHGFLRHHDGTITTFDVPGATNGTYPAGINPTGTITGGYTDASNTNHNFVRDRDGTFTTFDVPGANTSRGQSATAINPGGEITGNYFQPIVGNPFGGNYRGFVRSRDGTFSTFDAATLSALLWTFPLGINPAGAVTGYDNDGHNLNHGFVRDRHGNITTLDAPGAVKGTIADGINPAGAITGYYYDANLVFHGFVWKEDCNGDGHKNDCGKGE